LIIKLLLLIYQITLASFCNFYMSSSTLLTITPPFFLAGSKVYKILT
jgi:hypothetical protein